MSAPDEGLLTTREGVDEGSAASAAEGPQSGGSPAARGLPDVPEGERTAPPVDTGTDEAAGQRQPGQQLQAGEG